MQTLSSESIPILAPGLRMQWEKAQNCHVLLFPEGMVQLSDSASLILEQCNGDQTVQIIIESLSQKFPGADLADDVLEFLNDALTHVWIKLK